MPDMDCRQRTERGEVVSRFTTWLVCSLCVLMTATFNATPFDSRVAVAMLVYLAIPLFLHWLCERKQEPRP